MPLREENEKKDIPGTVLEMQSNQDVYRVFFLIYC